MRYYKAGQPANNKDSEGEDKEEGIENTFEEIMAENFPNIMGTDIKIEDQRAPQQVEAKQAHSKTYYNKNGKN